MKTLLISILLLITLAFTASAQTPSTNDIRVTWNCPLELSTNQLSDLVWWYKKQTNGVPNPPLILDWTRANTRAAVANQLEDMRARRLAEEAQAGEWARFRQWWIDATPAQRTAALNALNIP